MIFSETFEALTGKIPFPWQMRVFSLLAKGETPGTVSLPTGTGKTALIPIWLIALAWQAQHSSTINLPRRLVWVVNRRVVVDQATDEAESMVEQLMSPESEKDERKRNLLLELKKNLSALSCLGTAGKTPVAISTLRGQMADNREWMLDPSRPAIVVGTVDMIGSRLLFSGYGDGRSRRPFHAGLLGQDAWIVLDEAHLTPPFGELLRSIRDAQQGYPRLAPFKISLLSATQRVSENGERITIEPEDEKNPIIGMRLAAKKRLRIHQLNEKDNEAKKIVELAAAHSEAKVRVIIYVKSPKTATEVSKQLEKATH
jgi:CRISPR-associated endonuclease/helicase Cas3